MTWSILNRIGYGSNFNILDISGNTIRKRAKTEYGQKKIENEIRFLQRISGIVEFPVPEILEYYEDGYLMKYYKDYDSLYKLFGRLSSARKESILNRIYGYIETLHKIDTKQLDKEEYKKHILIETVDKLKSRHHEIESIIEEYNYIKYVNKSPIISFAQCLEKIKRKMEDWIDTKQEFSVCIIHGDCQFNNILYNENKDTLLFIDPRGYFGNLQVYGIPEYDTAKVKFALSGYDEFDNSVIDVLDIKRDTIYIPDHFLIDKPFDNTIESILAVTIWLGNANTFISQKNKCIYSYFKALYYASVYIE